MWNYIAFGDTASIVETRKLMKDGGIIQIVCINASELKFGDTFRCIIWFIRRSWFSKRDIHRNYNACNRIIYQV